MPKRKAQATTVTRTRDHKKSSASSASDKSEKVGGAKKVIANGTAKVSPKSPKHWLVKSEPESRFEKGIDVKFGFDDLKSSPNQTACWDGVRNYAARNYLRDQMKNGHDVFFYHSNCKTPGIVGLCKVVKESYPDHTQFDAKDPHYDGSSKKDDPRWFMVDVQYVRPLERFISLAELKKIHLAHKANGGPLKDMAMFTRARLSVQPISQEEWDYIVGLENKPQ